MTNVTHESDKRTSLLDKTFKDKAGAVALSEKPNLSIIVWFAAMLLAYLFKGRPELLLTAISRGALFTWAWLEIFQGVNYFRRTLGAIVMVYLLRSAVSGHLFI